MVIRRNLYLSEELNLDEFERLARLFGLIAVRAGEVVMDARADACRPDFKADGSPVTAADLRADDLIRSCLERNLPDFPIVSEESCSGVFLKTAERFILVDPLDGTKEFIQGRDEFTINIALIQAGSPVAGAVYAPALHQLYMGGTNAYRLDIRANEGALSFSKMRPIEVRQAPSKGRRAVVSRSHLDGATKAWVKRHGITDLQPSGSSLKFCVVAEGEADVYPRLAPTMEWDTAAGHAVLLAAGGTVTDLDGRPLRYGKPDYRSTDFVARGAPRDL
ncbi:3'(2'),5'-bisphosphate nucleotidase CysQ [Bradyrhizobium hipponense]|uniref:3'(2'),5'-bisphosphate nucleotidase CysQ n=2 Tax=Bradyrhizobium hipponense TaxID=2605638 RepID=A0A5S4YM57_9BRAD|nr:3'(2'),5'-bisphosphate nucleotidase CysQ [Bradyrhizobium hipponense]